MEITDRPGGSLSIFLIKAANRCGDLERCGAGTWACLRRGSDHQAARCTQVGCPSFPGLSPAAQSSGGLSYPFQSSPGVHEPPEVAAATSPKYQPMGACLGLLPKTSLLGEEPRLYLQEAVKYLLLIGPLPFWSGHCLPFLCDSRDTARQGAHSPLQP